MFTDSEIKAVVWDMDGLLLDTERLSLIAWQEGASAIGSMMNDAEFHELIGRNAASIRAVLIDRLGDEAMVATMFRAAALRYDSLIAEGAPLKPGAAACLELLSELKVPQALATSSSQRAATQKLGFHGLLGHLNAMVCGDHVSQGKPHPEPFLLAASRLGVAPESCIAFEDSVNGVKAASLAGMRPILVPDISVHDDASLARVWRQLDSLESAIPLLRSIFARIDA